MALSDDNIPDPSEFLFIGDNYDPQIILKMVMSMSRAMVGMETTVVEIAKVSVKTELALEKMANGITELVLAHNDTKKDVESLSSRIEDRKDENKKHTALIEKLFEKVEQFDKELHESCDIHTKTTKDYTDTEIKKVVKYISWSGIVAVVLGGFIYMNLNAAVHEHFKNTKIHKEHK